MLEILATLGNFFYIIGSQRVALNNSFDVIYNDNTFADVTDQEDPPDSRQEHVCNCASGPSSFF